MRPDHLTVEIALSFEDAEQAEQDLRFLRMELDDIDHEGVETAVTGPAPAGARSGGSVGTGALLVALGSSGAALPALIALIKDWLGRRRAGTIKVTIGSDSVEMSGFLTAEQQRALDAFLRRHSG